MKKVYMKVSRDEYRLPEAIADSPKELAKICGVSRNSIVSAISKAKAYGFNSMYIKVEIGDDDDGCE